jgi:glycosyltransferase involved in cell wall biosynthesis
MNEDSRSWPAVSVIMPVLNEERHLAAAVTHVLEQDYPGELELVIALGPSSDRTGEIARGLAEGDARVRLVDNPVGRTPNGLNAAIKASSHDIIVRVDGHGLLSEGYIRRAVEVLQETGAANVGGIMQAEGETDFERAVAHSTSVGTPVRLTLSTWGRSGVTCWTGSAGTTSISSGPRTGSSTTGSGEPAS